MKMIRNLVKRVTSDSTSNCVVCILRYTLLTGFFFNPFVGHCQHSKRSFSKTQHFTISKLIFVIDLLFFIFFTGMTLTYTYEIFQDCANINEKICCLHKWGDQIFTVSGLLCVLQFLVKIQSRLEELNTWAWLAENRQDLGIKNLICSSCTQALRRRNFCVIGFLFITHVFFFSLYIWVPNTETLSYSRRACIFLSGVTQFNITFQNSQQSVLMQIVTESLKKSISKRFTHRSDESLEVCVGRYVKFWMIFNGGYRCINKVFNPLIIVWLFLTVVVLIISFYLYSQNYYF